MPSHIKNEVGTHSLSFKKTHEQTNDSKLQHLSYSFKLIFQTEVVRLDVNIFDQKKPVHMMERYTCTPGQEMLILASCKSLHCFTIWYTVQVSAKGEEYNEKVITQSGS